MDGMIRRFNVAPMKRVLAVVLSIGFLSAVCWAEEKPKLTEQKDKESYSLGYQFGDALKKQGIELNMEIYTSAIKDGLAGKEPLMSQEEIRSTVMELQKRAMAARQAEQKEKAAKNLAEGKAFLEENKKKEGVKTLPSGLQYKVLKEGSGKTPNMNDTVTVHYRGTLIDGTEFDSSHSRNQPAQFGVKSVIRGWAEALQLMKEGSKWQLFIPPELAYGERGSSAIGPGSTLIFEVELVSVESTE